MTNKSNCSHWVTGLTNLNPDKCPYCAVERRTTELDTYPSQITEILQPQIDRLFADLPAESEKVGRLTGKGSYEAVFGHLGMTPDEIGNMMHEHQDENERMKARVAQLETDIKERPLVDAILLRAGKLKWEEQEIARLTTQLGSEKSSHEAWQNEHLLVDGEQCRQILELTAQLVAERIENETIKYQVDVDRIGPRRAAEKIRGLTAECNEWKTKYEAREAEVHKLTEELLVLQRNRDTLRTEFFELKQIEGHTHQCRACGQSYTPEDAGCEDCPKCGSDGNIDGKQDNKQ